MVYANDTQSRNTRQERKRPILLGSTAHSALVTFLGMHICAAHAVQRCFELNNDIIEKDIEGKDSMRESESIEHIAAKERIARVAIKYGMAACNEALFPCWSYYHNHPVFYRADVYIYDPATNAHIIQEIHGYKGHDSSYSWFKDRIRRIDDIHMWYGDNIEFPPPIDLDSLKNATALDIIKSMGFDA